MKKTILFVTGCLFCFGAANAQMSAVEIASQQTEAEKLLLNGSFVKVETISEYSDNGIEVDGKVLTDLTNNQKIGYLEFRTESEVGKAIFASIATSAATGTNVQFDGSAKPLGYLDLNHVNELVNVLQKIVDMSKQKATYKYTVSYVVAGGINVVYDSDDEEAQFQKRWYSTNAFGVKESYSVGTTAIEVKDLAKIITAIKEAQTKVQANLK